MDAGGARAFLRCLGVTWWTVCDVVVGRATRTLAMRFVLWWWCGAGREMHRTTFRMGGRRWRAEGRSEGIFCCDSYNIRWWRVGIVVDCTTFLFEYVTEVERGLL